MTRLQEFAERVTWEMLDAAGRAELPEVDELPSEAARAVLEREVRALVTELIHDPLMFSKRERGMARNDAYAWLDATPPPPQREATPCKPGIEAHFGPCSRGTPKAECRRVADEGTRNAIMVCACECHPDHAEPFPPAAPPPPPCTVCGRTDEPLCPHRHCSRCTMGPCTANPVSRP